MLVGYLGVMTYVAPSGWDGLYLYFHACFFIVLYAYAKGLTDLRTVAIGLGIGFTFNSLAVLIQQFLGWQFIPQLTPDAGLFFNRNVATEGAAMALMLVVGYRLWWLVPGLLPTLIWGSRSPTVALGCGLFLMLWNKSRLLAAGLFLSCIAIAWLWLQKHGVSDDPTFRYTTFPLETLQQRLGVWYDGMHGFTVFGQGLGSWLTNFPIYQRHSNPLELRWENAHNDAVQLVFEFGVIGAAFVALYLARLFTAIRTPAFYALVVFSIESLFEFPLYDPLTGALAAVCTGHLFSRGAALRDDLAGVGLRVRTWYSHARRSTFLSRGQPVPTV